MVALVDSYAETANESGSVYQLQDQNREILAGNHPIATLSPGFHTLRLDGIEDKEHDTYRLLVGDTGAERLTVGISLEDIDEVRDVLLVTFAVAAIFMLFSTALGGTFLTMRLQSRFTELRATLDQVSEGQWNARLPISKSKDDIDDFLTSVNRTFNHLQALMVAMRQISVDIAHDLKTPLARLFISAEEALEKIGHGETAEREVEAVRDEARTLNSTFEALLSIAQIEGGARKQRFGRLDLRSLTTDLVEIYSPVVEEAGCRLALNAPDDIALIVQGDRDLVKQLLANLIENAIRHCPPGTFIGIELGMDGMKRPTLSVADDGPGIPAEERENVLRRLYRLEKSRTTPGFGLGLSLVKVIADLHEADLSLADNQPGLRVALTFGHNMEAIEQP